MALILPLTFLASIKIVEVQANMTLATVTSLRLSHFSREVAELTVVEVDEDWVHLDAEHRLVTEKQRALDVASSADADHRGCSVRPQVMRKVHDVEEQVADVASIPESPDRRRGLTIDVDAADHKQVRVRFV